MFCYFVHSVNRKICLHIVIRGIPAKPPQEQSFTAPDIVDPSHVPSTPVQYISQPRFSDDTSSDSDSDDGLQISQTQMRKRKSVPKSDKRLPPQQQKQPMPFIRPDHTLLPRKRPSPTPSPPPPPVVSQFNHNPSAILASSQSLFNGMSLSRKQDTRNDSSLYCYCRRPYDEMYEMIACDANDCPIEWFHFECVGIKYAPQDKWFCPQCRPRYQRTS